MKVAQLVAFLLLLFLVQQSLAQESSAKGESCSPYQYTLSSIHIIRTGEEGWYIRDNNPSSFTAHNVTLMMLIQRAFDVEMRDIEQQPRWFSETRYDVRATTEVPVSTMSSDDMKGAIRCLLQNRFELRSHRETRRLKGYTLQQFSKELMLRPGKPEESAAVTRPNKNSLQLTNLPLKVLVAILASIVDRPVLDNTKLNGNFDVTLEFGSDSDTETNLPNIFTALREQAGLELKARNVDTPVLVIDHVRQLPTEN